MFKRLIHGYSQLLLEHPVKTKSITCGIITSLGDAITQNIVNKTSSSDNHSLIRSCKMFAYGCFLGPIIHNWLKLLEFVFPISQNATTRQKFIATLKRVGLEISIYSPFITSTFYTINTTIDYYYPDEKTPNFINEQRLRGDSLINVLKSKIERDLLDTYSVSVRFWPFVQTVNYFFTPLIYRPLVINFISVGWNAFLCSKQQQ
ncbi:hypothetical protein ABK040_008979 [Willaertia magna]